MTEPEKKESILDKLRKLMDHADSAAKIGNQAEAEAFAAKAQELMLKYEIELDEVERLKRNEQEPIDKSTVRAKQAGYKERNRAQQWQMDIAAAVSHAYNGTWSFFSRSNDITFYGRTQNREVMIYVFTVLVRTGERLMKKARKENAKTVGYNAGGFQNSFLQGYADAIVSRLTAERKQIVAATKNPHALVVIKNDREAVEDWVRSHVQFSTNKSLAVNDGKGYSATARALGHAAGSSVAIHRAATGPQGAAPKQLGGGR